MLCVPGVMLITGVRPMYKLPARTPNGNIESIIFKSKHETTKIL